MNDLPLDSDGAIRALEADPEFQTEMKRRVGQWLAGTAELRSHEQVMRDLGPSSVVPTVE